MSGAPFIHHDTGGGPARFIRLTDATTQEPVLLNIEYIIAVRPCGGAAYGSNIDINVGVDIVAVEEAPAQVIALIERAAQSNPDRQRGGSSP